MNKSQFLSFLAIFLLVVLVLNACAPIKLVSSSTPEPAEVRFESADCMFGALNGVACGYLYVPEDRSQPQGPQIQLAVAIIHSSNPTPAPDPVLMLRRWLPGAGAYTLKYTQGFMLALKDILADRDVVLLDQRGTGYSAPALNCPEVGKQILEDASQNLNETELQRHLFQAYRTCHDRLENAGINLSAYSESASAADINDLRTALGYTEWNLYGDSYGARLALRVMRDFPEGVRSVVLDSVYPLQTNIDAEAVANADRALKLIFEQCAADEACNAAYPDLELTMYAAADQLDISPLPVELSNPDTQSKITLAINGDRMINMLIFLASIPDALPYIPQWIYKFHEGSIDSDFMLKGYLSLFPFLDTYASTGMGLSIQCGAESNSVSAHSSEADSTAINPRLQEAVNYGRYLALCPAWELEPNTGTEVKPVVSDIPTLLLTGENDPVSPPAWSVLTAENLSNSYSFALPWASFNTSIGGNSDAARCAKRIASAFITEPKAQPDAACMDKLNVNFVTTP